jgi:hypothetical protein
MVCGAAEEAEEIRVGIFRSLPVIDSVTALRLLDVSVFGAG